MPEADKRNKALLRYTDWKVVRHRDQVDSGIATSLTDAEYQQLLQDRQKLRDSIIN